MHRAVTFFPPFSVFIRLVRLSFVSDLSFILFCAIVGFPNGRDYFANRFVAIAIDPGGNDNYILFCVTKGSQHILINILFFCSKCIFTIRDFSCLIIFVTKCTEYFYTIGTVSVPVTEKVGTLTLGDMLRGDEAGASPRDGVACVRSMSSSVCWP